MVAGCFILLMRRPVFCCAIRLQPLHEGSFWCIFILTYQQVKNKEADFMSPRTKEQNEEIREQRMAQIMKAAAQVFLDKGIMLEIRDVAARSGLGYGTVYHYFKNKQQLLEELLQQAFELAEELVRIHLLEAGDREREPMQRLKLYYKELLEEWMRNPALYILYKVITENFHSLPEGVGRGLGEAFQERLHQPVVEVLRQTGTGEPLQLANMMIGALTGFAGLHLHHRHQATDLGYCVEALLAGIGQNTTGGTEG
jgi:AcrR family transcriptional regulator